MPETAECQKFFALSKRVPKDVKRYCGICRQHGVLEETRGHSCSFKDCSCNKCQLVRTRRQIMSQQIRLRRAQDKRFQRTNEPQNADVVPIKLVNDELASIIAASSSSNSNGMAFATSPDELLTDAKNMCYFCQKCKNHEILVWKKQHKRQCPFTDCTCEKCELIETRRRLDQHMKKRRAALKNAAAAADVTAILSPQSTLTDVSASPKNSIAQSPEFMDHDFVVASKPQFTQNDSTIKIEDAFLQQKPMFAASTDVSLNVAPISQPQIVPSLPLFVPPVSFATPNNGFLPIVTSTPFILTQSDLLAAAVANMNAQKVASPQFSVASNNIYDLVKTITPPIASVSTSPVQMASDLAAPKPMVPQLTFKEMEQMLMLKYQMQQGQIH